ncbi:PepSY domain-containing protein [Pseudonocardia bannensis]|uniref:PepSY domain-containing protein n=1 Tax=Pseudonocardia bannensis TaxID=630973 RepID=A0A848DRG7_9PSEU|nr:PepSY domain-containing protein [Pseudonocardia bannensis]NMH95103.1 hypothetical protein [Pseudonocardia bannensis]
MATRRLLTIAAAGMLTVLVFGGTAVAVAGGADDVSNPLPRFDAPSVSAGATTSETTPVAVAPAPALDRAAAEQIALDRVGGGAVTRTEHEIEHGRPEWKVRIVNGGVEHDVRVDAGTGTVTRIDSDDRARSAVAPRGTVVDDRGRGSDDRPGDDRGRGSDDRPGDDRGRGSDDRGYDDRGGDRPRGNDDRGSDDRGSDDRGRGSDDRGSDDRGRGGDD